MDFVEASPSRVFRDGEAIFRFRLTHHPKFKRDAPAWRAPFTAERIDPVISRS
jgi:hypothetical protein